MKYENKKSAVYLPILLAIVLVGGILIGLQLHKTGNNQSFNIYPKPDKLNGVVNFIESEYVDTVSRYDLVEVAIPAMLKSLDPHSVYIPAKDLQRINEPLEGNFEGIGVTFNMPNDTVVIMTVVSGGPSELLGILPGDRIIIINETLVAGVKMTEEDIISRLKGPRGTKVNVGIERKESDELLNFEIKRDKIPLISVDVAYMMTDEIGYLKISKFSRTTYHEFVEALTKLKDLGLKKLIIDLRGNGGGYMDAATNIADQLLEKGKLIVYTEGKARPRDEIYATEKGLFKEGDLLILLDEWSASASEILAGAIQDNDRGTIMGRRSFGKGLVQEPMMLTDGSAIRLTIARYYTPTGRSIQKPYNNGREEYYNDLHQRYVNGEFDIADSIRFPDSLKFVTPGGKTVFGGGGIMPDIFVPLDTTGITPYFRKIRNNALIYRFSFEYTDLNRDKINHFDNYHELISYLEQQNLLGKFVLYARDKGIPEDQEGLRESGDIIHTQIKAYITRNIFDNDGFYPVFHSIDHTMKKAVTFLQKG
ncbi:MAG: S41 family peptidase [Bacteroidales bacterium]|nr:MAG: S41 family peptidase [Bacteroidales bacterium]